MESLELSNNIFADLDTTRLHYYFDRFKYRGVIKINHIEHFRYAKNFDDFYNCLEKKRPNGLWSNHRSDSLTIRETIKNDNPTMYSIIEEYITWKENSQHKLKEIQTKINFSYLTLYFNDFQTIKTLNDNINKLGHYFRYHYANEIPNFKKGVVYHKDPKHKFRLFFKSQKLANKDKTDFVNFLYQHNFILSNGLVSSISINNRILPSRNLLYLYNTHYVDYDDESLSTVMALSYPNLIGKMCTIEKY